MISDIISEDVLLSIGSPVVGEYGTPIRAYNIRR
jgi:hypothetical protein